MSDITRMLADLKAGEPEARRKLVDLVYRHLRSLAGALLRKRPGPHSLQPTELVHEAYLRLVGRDAALWDSRAHFYAACASVMRNILTDHARRRHALKRGAGEERVTLRDAAGPEAREPVDALALDEALTRLAALNARHARVVECRFFSGMTVPEIAEALGVSPRTVDGDWAMARAWLATRLSGGVR